MKVANPIYDVVFKYLMDDMKVAKLIISRIIGEEIISLDFKPTELQTKIENEKSKFTVFRIDFAAKLKLSDGSEELVIIEIQKAKFHTDIMRFRKYLGTQYMDTKNTCVNEKGYSKALPIKTIYFLGHKLDYTDASVVKVQRKYYDGITGEELIHKEEFIESLSHDSFVIQIPTLREKRRNALESLLGIFDQSKQTPESQHYLDLSEGDFEQEYSPIIRRLLKAGQEREIYQVMDIEDEILDELAALEREVATREKIIEDKDKSLELAVQALLASGKTEAEAKQLLGL